MYKRQIDGHKYLDGGVADSIPSAWLFAQGYDRNIVVLTQPAGFVKQPNSVMPMLRRVFRHYPEFVAALEHRHEVYNATLDDLARREAAGEVFVAVSYTHLDVYKRQSCSSGCSMASIQAAEL